MKIHARNLGCAGLVLGALTAWDVAVTTAGGLPGSEGTWLAAQETEARNQQDEERMFMEARRALNREEFDRASELFQALRDRYPVSISGRYGRFVPDSYYWEAFGRYRQGNLDEALMLLDLVRVYREAQRYLDGGRWTSGRLYDDVRELRLRIQRQLAEQGDPDAAEEVLRRSEAVLARDSTEILQMQRNLAEELANMQARLEHEQARFTPDTAAYREMQRQFEARMRELEDAWTGQQARLERELQQSFERYRVQLDSTDVLGVLRQERLMHDFAEAERMVWAMADSVAGASGPGVRVYRGPGGRPVVDVFSDRYGPVPAGIDIHWECEDALIDQEALTSLLRLEVNAMPTVRDILKRDDDCSAHLRYMALNWLGDEGTDEARELLMEVARDHPDAETKRWAVHGLEHYEAPGITELLLRMLESDDEEVQAVAIAGLYRHPSDAATEALIEFAGAADEGSTPDLLRQLASGVVAEHGPAASLPTVFNRFGSDALRRGFLEIVGARAQGGESEVTGWLLPVVADSGHSERVRREALQAWLGQPSLDLELVEEIYRSLELAGLRDQLLYALFERARSGTEKGDAVIDKMIDLAREEEDPEVRKRAVYWLGRTGSERAAEFLMEILNRRTP